MPALKPTLASNTISLQQISQIFARVPSGTLLATVYHRQPKFSPYLNYVGTKPLNDGQLAFSDPRHVLPRILLQQEDENKGLEVQKTLSESKATLYGITLEK